MASIVIFSGSINPPNGSAYLGGLTENAAQLIYDVGGLTGSPSLVLTLQEANPLDPSVPLVGGQSISTSAITSNTTGTISLSFLASTAVLVTWTISGGSFTSSVLSIVPFNSSSVTGAVTGTGTAGSPAPGVLTVQGISGMTPLSVTGSISATNPSVGTNNTTAPTSSTQIGFLSSSNLVPISSSNPLPITASSPLSVSVQATGVYSHTLNQDGSGNLGVNIENTPTVIISGLSTVTSNQGTPNTLANAWPFEITDGTNILGTSSHPLRIDPTGTTTQPISGTVTANAGTGVFSIAESVAALTSSLSFSAVNSSSGTTVTLVPAVAGQTIRVFKLFLVFGAAVNATFWNGTGPTTVLSGSLPFTANGSIVLDVDTLPWFVTSSGNAFVLNLSTSVSVAGTVYYTQS